MTVRLILAEDGFLMREGISSLLSVDDDLDLVAACGSYDELLEASRSPASDWIPVTRSDYGGIGTGPACSRWTGR